MLVYLPEQFESTLIGALKTTEEHMEARFLVVKETVERLRQNLSSGRSEEDRHKLEKKRAKRGAKSIKGAFDESLNFAHDFNYVLFDCMNDGEHGEHWERNLKWKD